MQMLPHLNLEDQQPSALCAEKVMQDLNNFCHSTGDCPIITVKMFAIPEAIRVSIRMRVSNIIEEGDPLVLIKSIVGQTQAPKQIVPLTVHI